MFASVRRYVGIPAAAVDAIARLAADVCTLLASVPGLGDCRLIRTRDGFILVLTGEDEATLVESGRRFAAWADRHVAGFRTSGSPEVWSGDLLVPAPANQVPGADPHATRPP